MFIHFWRKRIDFQFKLRHCPNFDRLWWSTVHIAPNMCVSFIMTLSVSCVSCLVTVLSNCVYFSSRYVLCWAERWRVEVQSLSLVRSKRNPHCSSILNPLSSCELNAQNDIALIIIVTACPHVPRLKVNFLNGETSWINCDILPVFRWTAALTMWLFCDQTATLDSPPRLWIKTVLKTLETFQDKHYSWTFECAEDYFVIIIKW